MSLAKDAKYAKEGLPLQRMPLQRTSSDLGELRVLCERLLLSSAIVVLGILCIVGVTDAGSLKVGPTLVVLDAKHPVATVRVTNNNDVTMPYETTLLHWTQQGNDDVYEPANDVIATPPIFELKAGETQILRVGMLQPVDAPTEVALRLYVQEVPSDIPGEAVRLRMAMRVGVPIFIQTQPGATSNLQWTLARADSGAHVLRVVNTGRSHEKILRVRMFDRERQIGSDLPSLYVLPGATREWPLPPEASADSLGTLGFKVTTRDSGERAIVVTAASEPSPR